MKERPIIFKDEMVCAILDGRKTQTRRQINPPRGWPKNSHCDPFSDPPAVWWWFGKHSPGIRKECPYGQVGDQLWVQETWRGPCLWGKWYGKFIYRADGPVGWPTNIRPPNVAPWRPSTQMARSASRITLEITGVRVERLQDISEEDAKAEGVERTVPGDGWRRYCDDPEQESAGLTPCASAINSFRSLWSAIKGDDSWNANPWVWVVEFKRVQP